MSLVVAKVRLSYCDGRHICSDHGVAISVKPQSPNPSDNTTPLILKLKFSLFRRGDDFGPVGSSNLLRCCASDRNLTLAMALFDRMVQCNVSV